jgi:hypothetical protein
MLNDNPGSEGNILERCLSDCEKTVLLHALRRTGGDPDKAAGCGKTHETDARGKISRKIWHRLWTAENP